MTQADTIKKIKQPITLESLKKDLRALGLTEGMNIIVHSSLSSLGWVCGGASAVVLALTDVISASGTILMPAHSSSLTEPSYWQCPPVPEFWWETIRETMPAFDPKLTPSENVGKVPEVFRAMPNCKRSYHPSNSFSAWGKHAEGITCTQKLDYSMSDISPLGELYKLDGHILLLGCGHESNTSLHLAETRLPNFPKEKQGGPIINNGQRKWVEYQDYKYNDSDFKELGVQFELAHQIKTGKIGAAEAKLIKMKVLVDFATEWISSNRYKLKTKSLPYQL